MADTKCIQQGDETFSRLTQLRELSSAITAQDNELQESIAEYDLKAKAARFAGDK